MDSASGNDIVVVIQLKWMFLASVLQEMALPKA